MKLKLTDSEVARELSSDSLLNEIRIALCGGMGKLEQLEAQRTPPLPIERRRMEFELAQQIIDMVQNG